MSANGPGQSSLVSSGKLLYLMGGSTQVWFW